MKSVSILSWNINSVRTKLEKDSVRDLLYKYDLISLNEIKTPLPVSLPGYVTFTSSVRGTPERGGTVLLIKNYLSKWIANVDTSVEDQIWLQLSIAPRCQFGFCYIPPADSQYYSHESFSAIQEKICSNYTHPECLFIGDMNTRFGRLARELPSLSEVPNHDQYSYPVLPDEINVPNDNAFILSSMCKESKLLLLNNLKTPKKHYISGKTFRKGNEWTSELDVCMVSSSMVSRVSGFSVIREESLPSDHAPITVTVSLPGVNIENLLARAHRLGEHVLSRDASLKTKTCRKPIDVKTVDEKLFLDNLVITDSALMSGSIEDTVKEVTDALYQCANVSTREDRVEPVNNTLGRWERLVDSNNDLEIWRAIDWKGQYESTHRSDVKPSDEDFKQFFESTLNPPTNSSFDPNMFTSDISIPILDEPITPLEVKQQAKMLKHDKASGPDGLSPSILKMLPAQWILLLTNIFNAIFQARIYPREWTRTRMCTLFKKGDRKDVNNYRGISIMNSMAKLYDMVLCSRLKMWFKPFREQAGAQEKRGCLEHIVSLRLLCDMARRKKLKLFVTFIDFSKAYDRVPRDKLFRVLQRLGCGSAMLCALGAMYSITESWVGTALILITLGVRQGSPTSCLLFIIFVNDLIRIIKEGSEQDGFLQWLHILILMDDTVILSTTRHGMLRKLSLLKDYCSDYGMIINQSKTKFMVINGSDEDVEPLLVNDMVVEHCNMYIYLGSPFTSDGSISSAVKTHASLKMPHVLKFVSFIKKNNDIPYIVKKRVFEAALMSTLLYGCESWVGADMKPMLKLYNWCLKTLLGVRRSTCNDVCYVESGYMPLKDLVGLKQNTFFRSMWQERSGNEDDPLLFVMNLASRSNTVTGRLVREYMNNDPKDRSSVMESVRDNIIRSDSSRRVTYKDLNPSLVVHEIYRTKHTVDENHRLSFTRFRVSGHSLMCETGRWNRRGRGRLPLEERLCQCGEIQTEKHVVEDCVKTHHLRNMHGFGTIEDLFSELFTLEKTCKIIHQILSVFY